jgi:AcrR family transcriptional regulator
MTKKKQRKDAQETRQRLLAAAAEVFAQKGYWESTHAEICRKAQANTAAVNYHFDSKENLYVESWKYAFEKSVEAHPPDGGIAPEAPVEERLRGRILAFMQRIADPDNYEIEIMHKEMANPTGLLTDAVQQAMERMRQGVRSIVRELLGDRANERQTALCVMSLVGQCFGPMLHLRRAKMTPGAPRPVGPPFEFGVGELADHVTQFSLAGMRGIRENGGPTRKSGRKPGRSVAALKVIQEEPRRQGQETGIPDAQPGRAADLRAGGGVVRYERGKNRIVRHG